MVEVEDVHDQKRASRSYSTKYLVLAVAFGT